MLAACDMLERMLDFMGGNVEQAIVRDCKRAIQDGMRALGLAYNWSYLLSEHTFAFPAAQNTGTINYNATTRVVTLSGATWPSWAARGTIWVSPYRRARVARVLTSSTVVLEPATAFTSDLTDSAYTLYQDEVKLPSTTHAVGRVSLPDYQTCLQQVTPTRWEGWARQYMSPGRPQSWTVLGDADSPTAMVLAIAPPPVNETTVTALVKRLPRPVRWWMVKNGTVSTTAGSDQVIGVGTDFEIGMEDALLRVGGNAQDEPTDPEGEYPAKEEGLIVSVDSGTLLTLRKPLTTTRSNVRYMLTDYLDIDPLVMQTALEASCIKQLSIRRELAKKVDAVQLYEAALLEAQRRDNRSMESRVAGDAITMRWP